MSLHFPYRTFLLGHSIPSLPGRTARPRSIISVTLIAPGGTAVQNGLLDTGADDTVFPETLAVSLGIDLTNAPTGGGSAATRGAVPLRYAEVTLRIADNQERREWLGWVGFTPARLHWPMLGYAGFLQYFTATFHGDRQEVELTVNGTYPGT
jgi:hypothetical protein